MPASGRKKSLIWNYFDILDSNGKKATCRLCQKSISYSNASMSNLNRHLKNAHAVNAVAEQESSMEVFTVQEVETHCGSSETPIKAFEIVSMKSLDELGEDMQGEKELDDDPDWTPQSGESGQSGTAAVDFGPSDSKKKKLPRRSTVWDHFEKSTCKKQGTCVHCGKVIKSGTISNLSRHLRRRHPSFAVTHRKLSTVVKQEAISEEVSDQEASFPRIQNYVSVPTEFIEVSVDNQQNTINVIENRVSESQYLTGLSELEFSNVTETNATQASQTEFLGEGDDFDINDFIRPIKRAVVAEEIDRELVKMIVKGNLTIGIVEQPSFQDFVSLLNPKYKIPSTNKITLELIPEYYQECEKKTTKSLKSAEGVCLYIDEWLSKVKTYLCITAHFINAECKFENVFLSCHIVSKSEEAPDVTDRVQETVKDWELSNKVVGVVTDSGSIAAAAVRSLSLPQIPNFMKTLSVVVHEGLQSIKTTTYKIRSVIDELVKYPNIVADVYLEQKSLKLPQVKLITKVKNDWSASFMFVEMLMRFEKLKMAIITVLNKHPEFPTKLSDSDWKNITSIVGVFNFFKTVKKEVVQGSRISFPKIIFYIRALKREMNQIHSSNNYTSDAAYLASVLETTLNKEFEEIDNADFPCIFLLLDPRLKKFAFRDESEFALACSKLKKEVCEMVLDDPQYPEPSQNSLWHSFDNEVRKMNAVKDPIGNGTNEVEKYLHEQLLSRTEDPLLWWSERRTVYPRLFRLAKKYLCVMCKTITSESISYKSAYMLAQLRNAGFSKTESEIMFLHHNM